MCKKRETTPDKTFALQYIKSKAIKPPNFLYKIVRLVAEY